MDLIIAILMFLNLIAPGETPSNEIIEKNQALIEQYSQDPEFMEQYHQNESVGVFDIYEGG